MKIFGARLVEGERVEEESGRGDGGAGLRLETKIVIVKRRIRRRKMNRTLSSFLEAIGVCS